MAHERVDAGAKESRESGEGCSRWVALHAVLDQLLNGYRDHQPKCGPPHHRGEHLQVLGFLHVEKHKRPGEQHKETEKRAIHKEAVVVGRVQPAGRRVRHGRVHRAIHDGQSAEQNIGCYKSLASVKISYHTTSVIDFATAAA
jgi:hypothetical protein